MDYSLVEHLSQPISLIDRELKIIYSNASRRASITSFDGEIVGKHCYTLMHGFPDPCWLYGVSACPVKDSFEKNSRESVIHKHLLNNQIVIEEVVSTPVHNRELVLHECRSITDLLGLKNGILVICSSCMNVRDEAGSWSPLENYLHRRTVVSFSHAICDACRHTLYPEME